MLLRKLVHASVASMLLMLASFPAFAADNDLVLSRFATFDPKGGGDCTNACGVVEPNTQEFESLVGDMGQIIAPRIANPAETLGEAGFAVNMMTSFTTIDDSQQYWNDAVEDGDAEPVFFTGHLQVRKGLPFSFEVSGDMGYIFNSEMFTLGSAVKWALNEGFYYFPDLAIRGTVNTLMGSRDLQLTTAGGDMSLSKSFGIAGITELIPYVGYQMLFIFGSSRLLNAYPQDPRPPQFESNPPPDGPDTTFSPEFVFDTYSTQVNRLFFGARLRVWILNIVAEGAFGNQIFQTTLSAGVDF